MPEVQQRSNCKLRVRRMIVKFEFQEEKFAKEHASLYEQTSTERRSLTRTPPLKYLPIVFIFFLFHIIFDPFCFRVSPFLFLLCLK